MVHKIPFEIHINGLCQMFSKPLTSDRQDKPTGLSCHRCHSIKKTESHLVFTSFKSWTSGTLNTMRLLPDSFGPMNQLDVLPSLMMSLRPSLC